MDQMRSEFEDWCHQHGYRTTVQGEGPGACYTSFETFDAWEGWKAAWERKDELSKEHSMSTLPKTG